MSPKTLLPCCLLLLVLACKKSDDALPEPVAAPAPAPALSGTWRPGAEVRMSTIAMITTSGVVTDTAVTGPFYRRMQQESPSNPVLPNFQFSGSPQMTLPATPAFIFGANDTVDYTIGGGSGVRLVIRQRTPDALMMEAVANSNTFYSPGRCFDLDRLSNRYNDSIISVYSGSTGGSGLVVLRRFTLLRENGKLYLPQAIAIYSNRSWNGFFQFGCSSSKAVWGGVFNDYAAIRSSLVANDTLLLQLKQTVLIQ